MYFQKQVHYVYRKKLTVKIEIRAKNNNNSSVKVHSYNNECSIILFSLMAKERNKEKRFIHWIHTTTQNALNKREQHGERIA